MVLEIQSVASCRHGAGAVGSRGLEGLDPPQAGVAESGSPPAATPVPGEIPRGEKVEGRELPRGRAVCSAGEEPCCLY